MARRQMITTRQPMTYTRQPMTYTRQPIRSSEDIGRQLLTRRQPFSPEEAVALLKREAVAQSAFPNVPPANVPGYDYSSFRFGDAGAYSPKAPVHTSLTLSLNVGVGGVAMLTDATLDAATNGIVGERSIRKVTAQVGVSGELPAGYDLEALKDEALRGAILKIYNGEVSQLQVGVNTLLDTKLQARGADLNIKPPSGVFSAIKFEVARTPVTDILPGPAANSYDVRYSFIIEWA